MKNKIIIIAILLLPSFLVAQQSQGGIPRGISRGLSKTDVIPVVYCQPPSDKEKEDVFCTMNIPLKAFNMQLVIMYN